VKIWFPTIRAGSGVDIYVSRLASALGKNNISAEITWFNSRFELAPFLLKHKKPPAGTDVIHANSWNAFAFKRSGIPLVTTEHHCVLDPAFRAHKSLFQHCYHQFAIRPFEKASFRQARKIIAVSNHTANSLRKTFDLTDIEVIHNWVDTNWFTPAPRRQSSKDKFRLLYVGNQSLRKGWDTACRIMQALGDDYQLAATAGLGNRNSTRDLTNILPLGRLGMDELVRAYQDCDALLFPSRYEGFGYVALEAMACGKPVIAANNSALPEVVEDGVTGILCDPDDVDCYVTACRKLKQDSALRALMGENARKRAVESFNEEVLIQKYIAMYTSLAR